MKIIAVINQKGGVGKTTTTANLGAALARLGKRVLLLDLDPQSNLTLHMDARQEEGAETMTQLLVDDCPIERLVRATHVDRLCIVPADTSLGGVEQVLANRIGRETLLREAFAAYPDAVDVDYALIDCPPSLGVLSANALCAADEVLIPMQTEYFSLQGMAKLTEVIELVRRRLNPTLAVLCVLPCMVDLRTRLTEEVLTEISTHFGDLLAHNHIRNNVKLAEAPSFGLTIFEHAPDSNGACDYWNFGLEVLERHGDRAAAESAEPPAADRVIEPADTTGGTEPDDGTGAAEAKARSGRGTGARSRRKRVPPGRVRRSTQLQRKTGAPRICRSRVRRNRPPRSRVRHDRVRRSRRRRSR